MKEMKVIRKRRPKRRSKAYQKRKNILLCIAMILVAVILVGGVCTVYFKFMMDSDIQTDKPETETKLSVIENGQTTSLILKTGDIYILSAPVKEDALESLEFKSSDKKVLTVDSGGRVDAKKAGKATVKITADNYSSECKITVEEPEADKKATEYTTAYIDNLDVVEKNRENAEQNLYSVIVNRRTNTVTVYTYDEEGDYTVPVRAMVCSCGEFNDENITPTGEYSVYFKSRWHALFGDVYGQYITGFSGHYLFHSVPYKETEVDALKTEEFNKLGTNASQGCVRMLVADTKWIYDNIEVGTSVEVIDDTSSADALGTPPSVKIDTSIPWDPTDPSKNNPYSDKLPVIKGVKDITVKKNSDFDSKVEAVDSCGQDISEKIITTGNVITNKTGKYLVTYSVTDDLGKTAQKTITVTVK